MDEQRPSGKPSGISKEEVRRAWLKVRASKGAPGVDEVTLAASGLDLEGNLCKVWNRMSSGSYFPPPVKAAGIPEAFGPGTRMLGVPVIADRVAQTVAAARIGAVAEPVFRDDSCGYRPGRSVSGAVAACQERCWKYDWVIDLDVQKFFGSVPRDLVLRAVKARVTGPWVILYVKRWLAAPVQMPDGTLAERDRGTPQGSSVSPVLAHLFLHYASGTWMAREFPGCPSGRYAGDAVVHCRSEARARQVLAAPGQRMEQAGLRLHPDKTRIVYCKDGNRRRPHDGPVSSGFLGFTFRARSMSGKHGRFTGYGPAISGSAMARLSQEVRDWKLHRHVSLTEAGIAQWISPVVRGWMNSCGKFRRSALYPLLARINYYLIKWMRRKYKRLRALKAAMKAWSQAVASRPGYFAHWRWVTSPWQ